MSLFAELQRRRVFRALVGYGIAAFAVLQIIEPIMHGLHWPDAVLSWVVAGLAAGFPIVVSLAWIFDVSEGRIERAEPAAGLRGARLAAVLFGIGLLAAAPGTVWYFFVRAKPAARAEAVIPSIAVLPFADMSPGKDQDYFSDGIAEEILNALTQVDGLKVAGRTSSFSFKGKNEDLRGIGEKLSVAHVLEGSVRKEANHVRITAQLISTADGYNLWSKVFDREMTGIFAVQDEIAMAVVEALRLKLLPRTDPASRLRREWKPEAYEQYLIARSIGLAGWGTREIAQSAMEAIERSLTLDPLQAPAWAVLSQVAFWKAGIFARAPDELTEGMRRAVEAGEKAVHLDPELAEAYEARGLVRSSYQWDWKGAQSDFERAIALNPGSALAHRRYGVLLFDLGRGADAVPELLKAVDLDPLAAGNWIALGSTNIDIGRIGPGRSATARALELAPHSELALMNLADSYLVDGQPARALAEYQRSQEEESRLLGTALAAHTLGQARESHQALDALVRKYGGGRPFDVAQVYGWWGDRDRAFEWLERALAQRDVGMRELKLTRFLRSLHGDPRFAALLVKMNLPLH